MKTEVERTIITCDVCGTVKEDPIAIAGFTDSLWENVYGYDLCYVCYHTLAAKVLANLLPEEAVLIEIEKMKKRKDEGNNKI